MRRRLSALLALALLGCRAPCPVHPALWRVDGPGGAHGWLFGTIHALPAPVTWQSPALTRAIAGSDRVIVEVANIADTARIGRDFAALAHAPGQPPLTTRVPPELAGKLAAQIRAAGLNPAQFADTKTWAAALEIAEVQPGSDSSDPANGIDRAVLAAAAGKPVEQFEGASAQFTVFNALSERDQSALLAAVVRAADRAARQTRAMEAAWGRGDMAAIDRDGQGGLLATPGLRAALLTERNRAWAARIAAELAGGAHPFVAVGAAHLAGTGGLPALLAARGLRVRRVQ